MGDLFDIGVERLMGGGVPLRGAQDPPFAKNAQDGALADSLDGPKEPLVQRQEKGLTPEGVSYRDGESEDRPLHKTGNEAGTFYLETFGCQMNEHDSEKVAGVLLARGYRQVETVDEAGVVLYNTCSIREKAAQKVFSRLGEFRPGLKDSGEWQVASGEKKQEDGLTEGGAPGSGALADSLGGTEGPPLRVQKKKGLTPEGVSYKDGQSEVRPLQGPASEGGPYTSGLPSEDRREIPRSEDSARNDVIGLRKGGAPGRDPSTRDARSGRVPSSGARIIGVLGCVAQQEGEKIFHRAPWVSLVCGSASYRKLPELLGRLEAGERRVTGLETDTDETFETEVTRRDNPWRAYLTIIEGCDKACSYCVVPFTRGPERSRASASILEEVRKLADVGYTEVQLLGQTVNSYADPTPISTGRKMRFSELLVAVAEVQGIRRVRFTTSHPRDFGKDIVEAIEAVPGICEHVHLPVQSGSTKVLRAMARTYTREEYLEKIAMLRASRREISLTTDLIVGFPGETGKDFEETLSLLDLAKYDGAFSFKYSPRPNTPSLKMEDAIPEEEKSRRLAILIEKQREIQRARNEKLIGRSFEVMVEGKSKRENQWSGHTASNKVMNFTSREQESLGDYVQVKVIAATPNSLVGEKVVASE